MNVLFALTTAPNNDLYNTILSYYKRDYSEEFTYKTEYYLEGILKDLNDEHFDVVVIAERLGEEVVDIDYIDRLTDLFTSTRVILIADDSHKGDTFLKRLWALGVYDCVFIKDGELPY
ncbi:MAG: hypothetical protein ACLTYB_17100, partial [Clostridium paraputrificum]